MSQQIHTQKFPAARSTERSVGSVAPSVIVLVHGAGEHSGRYAHVIEALTGAGYAVITGDLPGHGRSGGLPGHVETFDEYLDAVQGWMHEAEAIAGENGAIALIGHSMGGLTTIRYLQERAHLHPRLVSAVVTSPLLRIALEVPAWQQSIAGLLDRLMPRLRMANGISPSDVSRHPDVVRGYGSDPLVHSKVSVRWFQEVNRAMEKARAGASRIPVPMLVMQAGQDKLVAPQETERFFQNLPPHERHKFVPYPALYHELFNEPEREDVLGEVLDWIEGKSS